VASADNDLPRSIGMIAARTPGGTTDIILRIVGRTLTGSTGPVSWAFGL
jgi:hypothetical protein